MTLTYGSLFSGYGGLDMGVQSVLPGHTAWHCEFDAAPSKILAHNWPDVPNLGDITAVDWATVEPVDVLTGGFPCQDVSHAGRRAGLIRDGEGRTRSGLWGQMLRAIDTLRPRLVVAENVRGLLSAKADSDVEPCPWCMGDAGASPMRALGAVLADLADLGYDASWYGLRAADVGAAHGRFRVFIFAWPADADAEPLREHGVPGGLGEALGLGPEGHEGKLFLTPVAAEGVKPSNTMGVARRQTTGEVFLTNQIVTLCGLDPSEPKLLPTPRATDGTKGGPNQAGSSGDLMLPSAVQPHRWGEYAPHVARWEHLMGRTAPDPTEPGPKGNPLLSARFVEWLMGLPEGHVTDPAIGISRASQLKALGNGVVPAQSAAATAAWVQDMREETTP